MRADSGRGMGNGAYGNWYRGGSLAVIVVMLDGVDTEELLPLESAVVTGGVLVLDGVSLLELMRERVEYYSEKDSDLVVFDIQCMNDG